MAHDDRLRSWFQAFLSDAGAVAGTVHLCRGDGLELAAAVNIPEKVQQAVAWVPSGKGMAGLALERGQPVQTCNLQQDASGDVRPGARAVSAQAAVAMPVRDERGVIFAVVGVAFREQREIPAEQLRFLSAAAARLPRPSPTL